MIRHLKILFLVNWAASGSWPFREAVARHVRRADVLHAISFDSPDRSRLNSGSLKGCELYLPLLALRLRRSYDMVVSWSLRMGTLYGILNRVPGSPDRPCHVIQDFHVNPLRRDPAYRLKLASLKASLPGTDHILCTSREEEALYARSFGIPRGRLRFLPQAPPPHYLSYPRQSIRDYVFAYGNSDRDFDTLVDASRGLNVPVRILSQRYVPGEPLPGNVELIRTRRPESELMQLAAQARLIVIPLQDYRIASGQLSMLEAMALGRPLVVTENVATREYAIHGETARFYRAGSRDELRAQMQWLLSNADLAETMGSRAREGVSTLHNRRVTIFLKVIHELLA
ncbi:MAG: glycosyltransferase family 4 protein [Syntrophobacteraceae bacterium]